VALEKAFITNTETCDAIEVMFNPEEYSISSDVNYAQQTIPGLSAPVVQFVAGNMQTLEMELLVDTYEAHGGDTVTAGGGGSAAGEVSGNRIRSVNAAGEDVRIHTKKITDLMTIDPATHAPPVLKFNWGSLEFDCVLARVSQRFILFRPDGIPVRARLQVTFNEIRNLELEAKEIKRETADYSRLHVVGQGETLSGIAWRVYRNPALWRPIALRNEIDDPQALAIGQRLLLPQLPFRDPETGEVYLSS
jgi:nucleoid-associated protein YgaU